MSDRRHRRSGPPGVGGGEGEELLDLPLGPAGARLEPEEPAFAPRPAPPRARPPGARSRRGLWIALLALLALSAAVAAYLLLRPPPPLVRLSEPAAEFGEVRVGGEGTAVEVGIENVGGRSLRIRSLEIAGPAAEDFRLEQQGCLDLRVRAGEGCRVRLAFRPSAASLRRATLAIASNAANMPLGLPLVGTGVAPLLAADRRSLEFGTRPVGSTGGSLELMLTNRGSASLAITGIDLEGMAADEFIRLGDRCAPAELAPGDDCRVRLAFAPRLTGQRSATLRIRSDAVNDPLLVEVSGTGAPPRPRVSLSPERVDFGRQAVGRSSSPQSVRLTNRGSVSFEPGGVRLEGTARGFAVAQEDCSGRALASGSSCRIAVVFTPAGEGKVGGSLEVPALGLSVPLSGRGVVARLELPGRELDFDAVRVTGSTSRLLELRNSGEAALRVEGLAIDGDAAGDYAVVGGECASLEPGGGCALTLRFAPREEGPRRARLVLRHDGAGGPAQLALSGTGLPPPSPRFQVTPETARFGGQPLGERSGITTVTVRNTGSAQMTLGGVTLSGPNAADFQIVAGSCEGVPYLVPGSDCSIGVRFVPAAAGGRRAQLVIRHDAPGREGIVVLSGEGLAP